MTLGIAKELIFSSKYFNCPVICELFIEKISKKPVKLEVKNNEITVFYGEDVILNENLGEKSMFGVESISRIYEIVELIDSGKDWSRFKWNKNGI